MLLNDKEVLTKIANDPETELRIKNSLVDSVVKRVVKKCNEDLDAMVANNVNSVLLEMELVKEIDCYGNKRAGDKLREILKEAIKVKMEYDIQDIIYDEINKQMDEVKSYVKERTSHWIESHSVSDDSIKAIMKESIDRYVEKRLKS